MSFPFPSIGFHLRARTAQQQAFLKSRTEIWTDRAAGIWSTTANSRLQLGIHLFSNVHEREIHFCCIVFYTIVIYFEFGASKINPDQPVLLPVLGVFVVNACGLRPPYLSRPI